MDTTIIVECNAYNRGSRSTLEVSTSPIPPIQITQPKHNFFIINYVIICKLKFGPDLKNLKGPEFVRLLYMRLNIMG